MSERTMSRRALLARSAAVGGATAVGAAGSAAGAPARLKIYRLDPEWNDAAYCDVNERNKSGGCHGCNACHRHGRNKIFRSRDAADEGRAHDGCRCIVRGAGTLSRDKWTALFGSPRNPRRDSVDRRDPRTRRILSGSGSSDDSGPSGTTDINGSGGGGSDLPFTGFAVGTLAAVGAGLAAAGRIARGRRRRDAAVDGS